MKPAWACRSQTEMRKANLSFIADKLDVLNKDMTKLSGDISYSFDEILIPLKPMSIDEVNQFKISNSKTDVDWFTDLIK